MFTFDTEGPSAGKEGLIGEWGELDRHVAYLDGEGRGMLRDSFHAQAVYTWFLLDWVGLHPEDSEVVRRNITLGHHAIFDHYRQSVLHDNRLADTGDEFHFHYHHPKRDGSWGWNTQWNEHPLYEDVINRKVVERRFFPCVYCAGGYVETNESSNWLERWIPYDYSGNSPVVGHAYDWSRAPRGWIPYHPHCEDYQVPGDHRRLLVRRKPTQGLHSALSREDIREAVLQASRGERPILAIITHDYVHSCCDEFLALLAQLRELIDETDPEVVYRFRGALDAVRWHCALEYPGALEARIERDAQGAVVTFSHAIYQEQPWVVCARSRGALQRVDAKVLEKHLRYRIPKHARAVAASDTYGQSVIVEL